MPSTIAPALIVLGASAVPTARRIQARYPEARLFGLRGRVDEAEYGYDNFGETLRELYRAGTPIIALCAAGIVVRSLASVLEEKGEEPPVLALAEDGSAVVPLLGGLAGVNEMAKALAAHLGVTPAITTSGELRFGTCLLNPPRGYVLADLQQGKQLVSDLLAGARLRVEGEAPWLDGKRLPLAKDGERLLRVAPQLPGVEEGLAIYPQVTLLLCRTASLNQADVQQALQDAGLAPQSLAALLWEGIAGSHPALEELAKSLGVPLRFLDSTASLPMPAWQSEQLSLHLVAAPALATVHGQPRGRLHVVGLGPGAAGLLAPDVRQALDEAEDVLGYETYVKMAGPFRAGQCLHASDNREELQRAAHAFELAASGRRVVMVSSGDPGVFAMAAAVLEALEASDDPRWQGVELRILPGISAAMAAAALAGAPLGHDFCLISLSDNLKPWAIIAKRLRHAAEADLAMAFYNPISRARPWQLGRALELLREHREDSTEVVLARDVGRPAERLTLTTLGELRIEQVDMRTLVIIGSSQTRRFARTDGGAWVYTPRSYPNT
ncbi:precorrin-3B C(17)-methyltransferase [Pseudomonas sp. ABC1]|uniref:precorrin-3B C(17)-methyltransferase n=1 Tax=Pseudomonas sp. ABC1 TaxID=2748080 RepID=UPI0015C3DE05|nr:precorrin-3B C(17)-methyltransferase [Pseudomonas sp. ABC1]QLF91833.1 precorrin-3B C(17)-methyltransferase [Pseudomonas sp. ABC1]